MMTRIATSSSALAVTPAALFVRNPALHRPLPRPAARTRHCSVLIPARNEEANIGAELYYPSDTHWNQLGHDLAAATIYNYIKKMLPTTASKILGHER